MEKSGFYKLDKNSLLFAPNFVVSKTCDLQREKMAAQKYPVAGWYWFDNEDAAYTFFKINRPVAEGEICPMCKQIIISTSKGLV
jgi:hypothetical protein